MKKDDLNFGGYSKTAKYQKCYSKSFDEISKQAKALANSIKNSDEYKDFLIAKERLEKDELNKKVLRELREQQLNFQFSPIDDNLEVKAKFLNEMYMAVSLNPVISDYLNAEYKFGLIIEELKNNFEEIFVFEEGLRAEEVQTSRYKN